MGGINNRLTDFVSVVTAHEVSHQWWGHLVGWQTYRDQWLSEGLATFSAGLFLEATEKNRKPYLEYWEKARTSLLEKNEFGMRSVDAGPIYLGLRASTKKTMGAYQDLTYLKSGYVFHMLRMMMADPQTGDAGFIAMMKDFVQTHKNQNATLTSFAAVLERHIKPHMDLTGTGSMGWFMRQWLLETDVPRYELQWDAQPSGDGFLFKAKVTQSEVGDNFAMPVPIYLEHQDRLIRLGRVTLIGRQSKDVAVKLPFKPSKALLNANYDILEQK
jgi:aminopeptidase N